MSLRQTNTQQPTPITHEVQCSLRYNTSPFCRYISCEQEQLKCGHRQIHLCQGVSGQCFSTGVECHTQQFASTCVQIYNVLQLPTCYLFYGQSLRKQFIQPGLVLCLPFYVFMLHDFSMFLCLYVLFYLGKLFPFMFWCWCN